jgi:hypothetical protein
MNRKRLSKLRKELEKLRNSTVKALDLQRVAKQLGRRKVKRGKEPMWENAQFTWLRPLAIPDHGGGRDISPGVKNSVLNQLDDDLIAWDERITEEESARS